MGDVASPQYPQAPQPQPNSNVLLSDPSRPIGLLSQLQDYRLKQQQFGALAEQPQAALTGQNIANETALQAQQAAASRVIASTMAPMLSGNPKPTADDVRSAATYAARANPEIALKYPDAIRAAIDVVTRHPQGVKYGVGELLNSQLTPSESSGLVEAPPNPATGAPRKMTVAQSNLIGPRDVGLAPGEANLIGNPAERAAKLQATASLSPQYHADLDNLKQLSKTIDVGGPTVPWEKSFAQLASRFNLPSTLTIDQLKGVEEFDKIANQISLNQSQMFHGSDAGLHTVIGANPSSSMSKFGREGVIDMLQGNQDAIDMTRRLWLKARANGAKAGDYDLFADRVGQELDPRVFQFNRLSAANKQKFLSQMDPGEAKAFEEKYREAIDRKWVPPLGNVKKAPGNADKPVTP